MNREDVKQTMLLAMSEHHSGNIEEARQIVDAQLAALEAAGVRLVPVEELEDLLAGPAAWLDGWAQHVGTCWGGDQCACGLTLARHELAGAREALAASPYAPPGG
jgi:hypothetical protein